MKKMMEHYCNVVNQTMKSFKFMHKGIVLDPQSTPNDLSTTDEDEIYALIPSSTNGACSYSIPYHDNFTIEDKSLDVNFVYIEHFT